MSPSPIIMARRGAVSAAASRRSSSGQITYPESYYTGPLGANNILPPNEGAFLIEYFSGGGVTWSIPYENNPTVTGKVVERETAMGRMFDCIHISYWGGGSIDLGGGNTLFGIFGNELDENRIQWIHDRGQIPVISWAPYYTIAEINAGDGDDIFTYMANYFKQFPYRMMLRPFWEFDNDSGFTWAVGHSANIGQPFITAWRRVVDIFKAEGCNNVGFWWCPLEAGDRAGAEASYPGDAYVDWCGSDTYNGCYVGEDTCWGSSPNGPGWRTFDDIAAYTAIQNHHDLWGDRKPIVYGEIGTVWDPNPSYQNVKGDWYRAIPNTLKTKLPHCVGVSFFDADVSAQENARNNWLVDYPISNPDVFAGFVEMANDPWFNTADDPNINKVSFAIHFTRTINGEGGSGAYPYQAAVLALNPVVYWPLINGSGEALVGTDLTMRNFPGSAAAMVSGSPGSTAFVKTSDQGAYCAHIAALEFLNRSPCTFTFWAKPTSLVDSNTFVVICQRDQDSGGWSVGEGWSSGANIIFCRDFGATEDETEKAGVFEAGVASFVVLTYDGDQWEVFRDNVSKGTQASTGNISTNGTKELHLGEGGNGAGDSCFNGHLAEMAVFDYVLNSTQRASLLTAAG